MSLSRIFILETTTQMLMDKPWLKFYDYWVPASSTYPRRPVDHLLTIATMKYADRTATIFFGEQITYRELSRQVNQMAAALQMIGIQKGDRVGLMLPNCPQFIIAYFAILRIGAIVVNINPLYTPREIGLVLNESETRALFMMEQGVPNIQKAREAAQLPLLEMIFAVPLSDYMPAAMRAPYLANQKKQGIPTTDDLPQVESVMGWSAVMARGEGQQPVHAHIDPEEDVAVLQFTGGTTGTPKGAMLTHYNLMANALQSYLWGKEFLRVGQEISLTIIPLFHVYGMSVALNTGMFLGVTMVLVPRFDATDTLNLIKTYKPTYFPGVPTMYVGLLNHPALKETDISSLRLMNSGSAPLPHDVQTRFAEYCSGVFTEGYGLSEASPTTHSTPFLGLQKPGSIGVPFPDTDAKIVDAEGNELGLGEAGELIISGPQVMKGYYNRPEETAKTLRTRADGRIWLHTGDIAQMDADGYFEIIDRKKDLILVGGFNVYPREVEEVLYTHAAVQEVSVIGIPDAYSGETVKAFVVLKPGVEATAQELIAFARERLAGYKTPNTIHFTQALPKSAVGKVLRTELRKQT